MFRSRASIETFERRNTVRETMFAQADESSMPIRNPMTSIFSATPNLQRCECPESS